MNEVYVEYNFEVQPIQPGRDILIAELGEVNFESFVETPKGFLAYISKKDWHPNILEGIYLLDNSNFQVAYDYKEIKQENWNATWEQNFNPIIIGERCSIRAPFHKKTNAEYEIIVEPKMSFGTGHHETTHMMVQFLLEEELENKKVLDMGCGTSVLAILAEKRGAKAIDAIDVDNWCYLNSLENIQRNKCSAIDVIEGDARLLKNRRYDVIIANINRNILLEDIPAYAETLNANGTLLLSGFYKEDLPLLIDRCKQFVLEFVTNIEKNNWVAAKFCNMQ